MFDEQTVIEEMLQYMCNTLEQSHSAFGDLPICPFARQTRMNDKVQFFVYPFDFQDISSDSLLIKKINQFSCTPASDVLVVVHPMREALDLVTFDRYLNQLNEYLHPAQLVAFGGHPQDLFNIEGVLTRQDPYINFVVQSISELKQATQQLLKTRYYDRWSEANLKAINVSR
jgi:hypothetical protein